MREAARVHGAKGWATFLHIEFPLIAPYILIAAVFRLIESLNQFDIIFLFILGFRFAPVLLVVIPLFSVFQTIGLYDTYIGMIWVYQVATLPMMVWMSRSYIEDIPKDIEEAAAMDGAKPIRVVLHIVLPLLKPGLIGAPLLIFLLAWHNFALGLILSSTKTPVTVALLKLLNPGVQLSVVD
ncbi:ABC transporter permease subunit [Bradyrhizobium sp. BR 1432]|uniref:ABC transporter permease subunit n=1 Tax=Bradyrhizobium sp. BR 1432 TaxID=3447966 RepID=UPI003EE6B024